MRLDARRRLHKLCEFNASAMRSSISLGSRRSVAMAAAEQAPVTGDLRLPDRPGMYEDKDRWWGFGRSAWQTDLVEPLPRNKNRREPQCSNCNAGSGCVLCSPTWLNPLPRSGVSTGRFCEFQPCPVTCPIIIWLLSWLSRDQGTRLADEVACACPCHWKGRHNAKVGATHAGFKL